MRSENFHYLSYLFLFFLGTTSRSHMGAGMRLVVGHHYCRPARVLFIFLVEVLRLNFFYTITEELHESVFFS
jgi:hypothetical protein